MRHATALVAFLGFAAFASAQGADPGAPTIDALAQRLNVSWDMAEQVRAREAYKELLKRGPAIVPACVRATEEGNGSARMWAAAALAQTGDPRGLKPLLKLLTDGEQKVRMIASYHIHVYMRKNPEVAPALGAQLADPDPDVREQAMKVLRKSKPPGALPSIKKALLAEDLQARADALRMVLFYEKKRPDQEIPKIVHSDADGRIRSAALWVWPTAGKGGVERVLEIVGMMKDPDPFVAEAALILMQNFFKEPPLKGDDLRRVVTATAQAIGPVAKHKDPRVRRQALPLLGHMKREGALPHLAGALKHDPDAEVRVAAAQGLARSKRVGAKVLGPLVDALEDTAPEVRSTSLKLIGALAKRDAMPPAYRRALAAQLAERTSALLTDGDAGVRAAAYVTLAELLKTKVADPLLAAVKSESDPSARKGAVIGLYVTQRSDSPALEAFVDAIGDADPAVSGMAAKVAKKLMGKGVEDDALRSTLVAKLKALAASENAAVRTAALPVLGALAKADAVEILAAAVRTDPSYTARQAALDGLARTRVRSAAVVDAAIVGLKDDFDPVRELALKLFQYLTRQRDLAFSPKGKPEKRGEDVAAIEKWWAEQRGAFQQQPRGGRTR